MSAYVAGLGCLCPCLCALSALLVGACHVRCRGFVTMTRQFEIFAGIRMAVLTLCSILLSSYQMVHCMYRLPSNPYLSVPFAVSDHTDAADGHPTRQPDLWCPHQRICCGQAAP